MKKLLIIVSIALLFSQCSAFKGKEKDDNTGLLLAMLAANSAAAANCSASTVTPITNKFTYVTSPQRTQYKISGCDTTGFTNLGFTSTNLTTGATGTGTSSLLATIAAAGISTSRGGTNIELTFKLNGSSGSLDVIAYGSGTSPSISGPTYRLTAGSKPMFKKASDGSYMTVSKGSSATTTTLSADTTYTYCLDFQYTSGGMAYMNGWEKACSEVTSTERQSMAYYPIMVMMNVPSYSTGNKIGFILNNATITSFTIGTILSETE